MAHARLFLSTVSAEFHSYRDRLRHDLTRPNVSVAVQEDFIVTGTETLDMLDDYIRQCDAVIHLVGDMTGALAQTPSLAVIRQRYHDLGEKLPPLAPFLEPGAPALSYTQWEGWLALYHGKPLILAVPEDNAPRDERYELIPNQRAAQQAHLTRLAEVERYPFRFANVDRLAVEVLRSKLQEILTPAEPPTRPAPSSDPNLLTLLRTVKRDWIDGVLANSLHGIGQLELGKQSYTRAIDHPLKEVIEIEDQHVQPLPSNTRIIDIFRRAGDFLLILGEPGAGKTITLLELASDLIAAAEADPGKPVPVVLNLSTWKESDTDLTSWIIVELKSKYFVGERLSKKWLKESRLLLMLDGLDEVKASARAHCVKAINAYLEESTPVGMVVACRFAEYEDLPIRLRFKGAIKLLPLTTDQIDRYLAATGLEAIRAAVQGDAQLRELARTPLVLNIMVLAYKDEKSGVVPIETDVTRDQLYKNLMDRYIAKMFRRKGGESKQPYTQETVLYSLSWLAQHLVERSQTVFLIESLQPDWLAGRAAWAAYWVGTRVTWAAVYGLAVIGVVLYWAQLLHSKFLESEHISLYVVLGFFSICCIAAATGFFDGRFYNSRKTAQHGSSRKRFVFRMLLYGGSYVLMAALPCMVAIILLADPSEAAAMILAASASCAVYVRPIASYRSIKRDIRGDIVTTAFGWSWKRAERGYIWAIFSMMVLFGIELPIFPILVHKMPATVGIIGVCTAFHHWCLYRFYCVGLALLPIPCTTRSGRPDFLPFKDWNGQLRVCQHKIHLLLVGYRLNNVIRTYDVKGMARPNHTTHRNGFWVSSWIHFLHWNISCIV